MSSGAPSACSASGTPISRRTSLNPVELEERTIEQLPDRCENCGASLTKQEKQRILDEGASVALCTICAAEASPIPDAEAEGEEPAY